MSSESLAEKVSTETPWWATAPIWLAAGIVGVPSLIAIGAGYFIASSVTAKLAALDQYNQSELYQIAQHQNDMHRNWSIVLKFMDDDLKCQYATCVNAAKNDEQRSNCLTPSSREQQYGMPSKK